MSLAHLLADPIHFVPRGFHDDCLVDARRSKRARQDTPRQTSPCTQVLLSPEMMAMVVSFQNGMAEDMLPFLAFDPKRFRRHDVDTKSFVTMDRVHDMLASWLLVHDVSRLRRLFERLRYMRFLVALDAVYYSNMSMLDTLHTSFDLATFQGNFLDVAAMGNNLTVLRYLHEHGHNGCTTAAMDAAAKCGNLEMVEFLHKHRGEGCTDHGLALATIHGHTAVARYLQDHGLATYEKNWLMTALHRMRSRKHE